MIHRALAFPSLLACLALAACSDNTTEIKDNGSGGGGGSVTTSAASSGSGAGDGASASSAGSGAGSGGGQVDSTPIDAPKEQWTWVPSESAFCANGTATGIGVNLTDKSKRVLIYLEGGGACWNQLTCYGFNTAVNIKDGYGEAKFAAEAQQFGSASFFNRQDDKNPFKDYSFVFVPYCTGDVHAGSNVVMYDGKTPTMHVGFENMGVFLKRIVPTFPDAERVFLSGSSAGGFGALANWWRTQGAFGQIRVDLIDDSGTPLPVSYGDANIRQEQRTNWNLDAAAPPDCATCKDDLSSIFSYYGQKFADHRGALLSFLQDPVLSQFSLISVAEFEKGLEEMRKAQIDPNPSLHYFFVDDMKHVLWGTPTLTTNGVTLEQWLTQMVTDDAAWASQHP